MVQPALEPDIAEALREWFDAFPADNIRKRVEVLDDQLASMQLERDYLHDQLRRYDEYVEAASSGQNGAAGITRRDAIVAALERQPEREFKFSELQQMLIGREIIVDSKSARHSLQVLMGEMVKNEEIARERKGYYKARPPKRTGEVGGKM